MEFKPLELSREPNWFKRTLRSKHFRKSVLFVVLGAVAGFGIFYLTEGKNMNEIVSKDIISSVLMGAFFGFFVTNSPCARGRC